LLPENETEDVREENSETPSHRFSPGEQRAEQIILEKTKRDGSGSPSCEKNRSIRKGRFRNRVLQRKEWEDSECICESIRGHSFRRVRGGGADSKEKEGAERDDPGPGGGKRKESLSHERCPSLRGGEKKKSISS